MLGAAKLVAFGAITDAVCERRVLVSHTKSS
jgi:hypothetical protein